jgi:hypothetical protein
MSIEQEFSADVTCFASIEFEREPLLELGVFMPFLWRGRQFSAALMQRSLSYPNGQFL